MMYQPEFGRFEDIPKDIHLKVSDVYLSSHLWVPDAQYPIETLHKVIMTERPYFTGRRFLHSHAPLFLCHSFTCFDEVFWFATGLGLSPSLQLSLNFTYPNLCVWWSIIQYLKKVAYHDQPSYIDIVIQICRHKAEWNYTGASFTLRISNCYTYVLYCTELLIHFQVTDEKRNHRYCFSCANLEKAEKRELCVLGRKLEDESSQSEVRLRLWIKYCCVWVLLLQYRNVGGEVHLEQRFILFTTHEPSLKLLVMVIYCWFISQNFSVLHNFIRKLPKTNWRITKHQMWWIILLSIECVALCCVSLWSYSYRINMHQSLTGRMTSPLETVSLWTLMLSSLR